MARLSVFAKLFQSRLVRLRHNVNFVFLSGIFDFNHGAPRLTLSNCLVCCSSSIRAVKEIFTVNQTAHQNLRTSVPISGGLTTNKSSFCKVGPFNYD